VNISRRELLSAGALGASVFAMSGFRVSEAQAAGAAGRYAGIHPALDRFAEQFMRDMNSPGMTLVLADRDAIQRVVTYGFGDLEGRRQVEAQELFQIGSISKSFVALALLQLRDEGKLDLHRPVVEYLPWLPISSAFAPITAHHLLTHSSGVSAGWDLFPSDPEQGHLAAYGPGEHFHYNNMAYEALGHLAWTLDGRELPEILRDRIFRPLKMSQSEPAITFDVRGKTVKSHVPFLGDRPFPRDGRLGEGPGLILTSGAGCVASNARDMGAYVQMIARLGRAPGGRLVSEESFKLFSSPHMLAEDFGPGVRYGYGIAVDTLDGNRLLRHTGGMVSFMSSMMVDIDEGVGGFASVNAQQNYRPNAVVRYAIQLMRAQRRGNAFPAMPEPDSPTRLKNASDFAGAYAGGKRNLEIQALDDALFVIHEGARIPLERLNEPDHFIARHSALDRFALVFGRKDAKIPDSAVVEVRWGGDWYRNARYDGPTEFRHPEEWESYVGHYRNENPWVGSLRIVLCKGRLMIDGTTPLEADGELFRLRSTPWNTDWIRFGEIVNGRCMRLKLSGSDLWRVATA
jgi:CubicO group peptidase (beta-lactamase class C family)